MNDRFDVGFHYIIFCQYFDMDKKSSTPRVRFLMYTCQLHDLEIQMFFYQTLENLTKLAKYHIDTFLNQTVVELAYKFYMFLYVVWHFLCFYIMDVKFCINENLTSSGNFYKIFLCNMQNWMQPQFSNFTNSCVQYVKFSMHISNYYHNLSSW